MKKNETKTVYSVLLGIGFVAAILAICFFVFHIPDFWPQLLAIIASAFLGAGATAWITKSLLKNQQESEEKKKKNIKVFENKIQVYSEFISKMWKTLEDDIITDEEIRGIRLDFFNKLIFYFDDIDKLVEKVDGIKSSYKIKEEEIDNSKRTQEIIQRFSDITELLRKDVVRGNSKPESESKSISNLWNKFGIQPRDSEIEPESNEKMETVSNTLSDTDIKVSAQLEGNAKEDSQRVENAWHFNAWGDEQFKRIEENLAESKEKEIELSLVEYGEYWRTNLLKQVGEGDIIMLFRRGGKGYVGAFEAIGRRIFDFEKGEEEILYFEENKPRLVDNFDADVEKYDIYKSRDDGATLCSNLIVKRIAYVPEGVGNPGGVYRRTISRYDSHYVWLLKKRFQEKEEWNESE